MIATNAFKQAVVGTYTATATVIELNSISNTVGNADYLPNGGFNLILYDGLFGNPADANNGGDYEILECSSVNYATNEITVVRARENTTAVIIDASSWQVVYGATVAFFAQFEDADATILKQADVVDTLVSTSVIAPLSANQGKELQDNKEPADATILKQADVVDTLVSTSTIAPLSANQGKELQDTKIPTADIINDLTTGGATKVLSAEQGVELKDIKLEGSFKQFYDATLIPTASIVSGVDIVSITGLVVGRAYEVDFFTTIVASAEGGSIQFEIAVRHDSVNYNLGQVWAYRDATVQNRPQARTRYSFIATTTTASVRCVTRAGTGLRIQYSNCIVREHTNMPVSTTIGITTSL